MMFDHFSELFLLIFLYKVEKKLSLC